MKKCITILSLVLLLNFFVNKTTAQCSLCTKTAMQMGEKPAQGMNSGILYLMLAPFAIVAVIGYRWWKNNKAMEAQEEKMNTTTLEKPSSLV
jgi:hypothetical protein